MNSKEILVSLIVSKNEESLKQYGIALTANNLQFSKLTSGQFEEVGQSFNTQVTATCNHPKVSGSDIYLYNRVDISDEFIEHGVTAPEVEIDGNVTKEKFLAAFQDTYGVDLMDAEVSEFEVSEGEVVITIAEGSLAWTGSIIIAVVAGEDTDIDISELLPNRSLNGFEVA